MGGTGKINHDTNEPSGFWIYTTIFIILGLVTITFIWSLYFYQVTKSDELLAKQAMYKSRNLTKQRLYEKEFLNRFEWKNKENNQVYLPIDLAVDKVINLYK